MNKIGETNPGGHWRVARKDKDVEADNKEPGLEEGVPLSVRKARAMRRDLWPYCWMSFASIIILAVALAILTYRMGVQGPH